MLNIIGLGLWDERDLTFRALDVLKASERVYLEGYTSYYNGDLQKLKDLIGKDVVVLGREDLEQTPEDTVLAGGEVSLLVMGDPLSATTHADLLMRAAEKGVKTRIIHNASVMTAVAETGLQLYKFGRTTTIAYPEGNYFPKSPYEVVKENKMRGLHTLCLLDVKSNEKRYMTINEGIELLLKMEEDRMQNQIKKTTPCIGVARLGGDTVIKYGSAEQLMNEDFGGPPHTLIIPSKLHEMEEEFLKKHKV